MNHNSGLGGPGYIGFITRDKEYILSFLNIPFNEYALENIHPFLKRNMVYYAFEKLRFKKLKSYVYVKETNYWIEEIGEYEYGEFSKAFSKLEDAEDFVVDLLKGRNFNKNNVVNSLSKKEEQNERVRCYKPIVLFGGNAYKIIELTKKYSI